MIARHRILVVAVVAATVVAASVAFLTSRRSDDGAPAAHTAESTTTSATTPSSTTTVASSTTTMAAAYRSSVSVVTAEQLGATWHPGCPVPVTQLRAVDLAHWDDGRVAQMGRVIVHVDQAAEVEAIFRDLFTARVPIHKMVPIDAYGGDDQASMRDNNTSAFNCRVVAGTSKWSQHAYGRAIDVNPLVNPYVRGSRVDPPEGAPYADRTRTDAGMIHAGDATVAAFGAQGWGWGGAWSGGKDYQHFSASGR